MRFFFFNDTATTEIYTLSLHDALPIYALSPGGDSRPRAAGRGAAGARADDAQRGAAVLHALRLRRSAARGSALHGARSEEHTSELQSRQYLVCRLLLEKKKKTIVYLTC